MKKYRIDFLVVFIIIYVVGCFWLFNHINAWLGIILFITGIWILIRKVTNNLK